MIEFRERSTTTPRLLSVNVGLPRDILWNGKIVRTSIWKDPVRGRRRVLRLNVDGDGQGDLVLQSYGYHRRRHQPLASAPRA